MMRMIALIACLQQQSGRSRIGPRLMATAFTPQLQRKQSIALAPSLLSGLAPFATQFVSSLSHYVHNVPTFSSGTLLSSSTSKLYSTATPPPPTSSAASSNNFDESLLEIDPYSHEAKSDLISFYKENGIDDGVDMDQVHDKLLRLTEEVLSWNQRLNLVSRKDCTAAVIYHRLVLPSVALLPLILDNNDSIMINSNNNAQEEEEKQTLNIVDVGTGGGFPGLPLALLLPHVQFTLVDSVQKKLVAVGEMAAELEMTNVRIHCGRVEEMYEGEKGRKEHFRRYDVVLGRSVTALPRFCGWVSDLLKKKRSMESTTTEQGEGEGEEGRLIYIIGGDLGDLVESRIVHDIPLDQLLQRPAGSSDKRGLIFTASDVEAIGLESGEKQKIVRSGPPGSSKKNKNKNNQRGSGGKKMAKGAWSKKRNDIKKERGYDNFQRYES